MSALNEHATFAPNFSSGSTTDSQSALPYTPAASECKAPPKESLNQLRSSFNLPESGPAQAQPHVQMQYAGANSVPFLPQQMAAIPHGMTSPLHSQPVMGAMTQPFPIGQPFPCGQPMIGPFAAAQMPFAAAQFHNTRGHNVTQEQLAAAFLAQDHRSNHVDPPSSSTESAPEMTASSTLSETAANAPPGGTIAPPPPPARPVHRRISQSAQPSSSEWPDENKENGNTEEPVWVLRDSYLKRMQRETKEEEHSNEWNGDANAAASASSTAAETPADGDDTETDRLLHGGSSTGSQPPPPSTGHGKKKNSKESKHSCSLRPTLARNSWGKVG
ncbi:hypothetical protein COOONC_27555 [Cooperia oncophora]